MQHMVKRLVCLAYHMAAGHCAAVAMVCAVAGLGFGARAGVSSTGAEGLTVGGDTVLRFTSTAEGANSFTLDEATEAWILCVGGGGGGSTGGYADLRAAGGGAGGMLEELRVRLEPGTYSVKVGQGGAAQANGTPSTITLGETELYKALGGGASPSWGGAGNSGGSGGGGALKSAGGAGTAGQGNAGGSGSGSGGGGGGAGEPGHAGDAATDPGAGGAGRSSAITGSVVYYAGGGSGQRSTVSALGGGGRGGGAASSPGAAGTNGLGGGGGGGGGSGGGRGGNGVVIVRLLTSPYVSVPVPIASELSYTGTEQVGVPTGLGYSIINNTGTNAGSYMATASLEPGYCWPNGERTDTNIVWTIDKAVNTWLQAPALSKDRWAANGRAAVLSEGVAMFGTTVATIAREGAAAEPFCGKLPMTVGRYALTYAVEESANASALSQTLSFEVVDAEWEVRKSGVMARGAFSVTRSGKDIILVFTNAAPEAEMSFGLVSKFKAWILCVGGGGGGSAAGYDDLRAGGGGAGGMVENPRTLLEPGTYFISVGKGGAATQNGNSSTIAFGETELYKAVGGGAAQAWGQPGNGGGSGGGGSLKTAGGAGIAGQGHDGGAGGSSGGGGGGAGEPGHAGNSATDPGAGGAGRSSAITGTDVCYAGGGSGQRSTISAPGGGGRGSGSKSLAGGNGTNGLGGGGGGGGNGIGGSGGSGVVVVRLTVLPGTAIILR